MILFSLLKSLSYTGAIKLLLEEGYVEEPYIEKDDDSCDKLFVYPFSLYNEGKLIDKIYYLEYCNLDETGEYEDFKTLWSK